MFMPLSETISNVTAAFWQRLKLLYYTHLSSTGARSTAQPSAQVEGGVCVDAMTRVAKAADGLLFSSEADYPLEPFVWTDPASFSPDALYKLTSLPPTTPVTKEDIDDFFAPMLDPASGDTPTARKRRTRFRKLVRLLRQDFSDLAVYKLGTVEMPTFIVGRLADGTAAGLRTTVVET
jgi:nuclease A inhibitor-like protein